MNSYIRYCCLICFTFILLSAGSRTFGQDGKTPVKGYVKMEVGAMGLHCPFLGVTLKEQLEADSLYSELKVDKSDHFLTFAYFESEELTSTYFQNIAVRVGYPAEIIIITLFNSQPAIEVRQE